MNVTGRGSDRTTLSSNRGGSEQERGAASRAARGELVLSLDRPPSSSYVTSEVDLERAGGGGGTTY